MGNVPKQNDHAPNSILLFQLNQCDCGQYDVRSDVFSYKCSTCTTAINYSIFAVQSSLRSGINLGTRHESLLFDRLHDREVRISGWQNQNIHRDRYPLMI